MKFVKFHELFKILVKYAIKIGGIFPFFMHNFIKLCLKIGEIFPFFRAVFINFFDFTLKIGKIVKNR